MAFDLQHYTSRLAGIDCMAYEGYVERVSGAIIESRGPSVGVGQLCEVQTGLGGRRRAVKAEVIGFRGSTTVLMPLEKMDGVQSGDRVVSQGEHVEVQLSENLLGRVLNGLGEPIDSGGEVLCPHSAPIYNESPHPLERQYVSERLETSVRAIDGPLTLGKGQRIGIFAGSGVGKSVLLGQIARFSDADANVIALTGERGREVGQFIRDVLGEDGLRKSVVVVATADAPPLLKVKAAFTATAIAEYLRDRGRHVLYMMDSITRVATGQREVGLAAGEPPTARGYPPSVFSLIPSLTERLGNSRKGSITGIYTVLVERDDFNDPVVDAVRASLDGHIVLSRSLADRGQYPAIDIPRSVSRTMENVTGREHLEAVRKLRNIITIYRDAEDLINIGAYEQGTNPKIDSAIELMTEINRFLGQKTADPTPFETTLQRMKAIANRWEF